MRQQTINGSDDGLSPIRRQAFIWPNYDMLPIKPLEAYFTKILFEIQRKRIKENEFQNIVFEMAAILSRP